MTKEKPAMKPAMKPAREPAKEPARRDASDQGESVALMEPLLISQGSRHRPALTDLAVELAQKSSGFRRSLPPALLTSLATLVRAMNCYYSNLIEGHDTHPIDIERALRNDYSQDAKRRDLQQEARAHMAVQQWIDDGALGGSPDGGTGNRATTADAIREIHRRFCDLLPDDLLRVEDPATGKRVRVIAGELRDRDVRVGNHVAINPRSVSLFLQRFENVYSRLGKSETILAAAAAHHRLVWIHPFLDGNGRVARLMSHATLLDALDTGGVWSIARGLARTVDAYKHHLAACDLTRRNDLDGRGNLSEESLAEFTRYFLETCIDQVSFMESLMQPELLRTRITMWAEERIRLGRLPQKSGAVLEALLYRGQLPRGDVAAIVNASERSARRIVAALTAEGVIASDSSRAALRLAFPASLAARWTPGLFPEKTA